MRAVIQRANGATLTTEGQTKAHFEGLGYVILLGIEMADNEEDAEWLARKIVGLRVFDDDEGVMNKNIQDISSVSADNILVVSQFTLMASYKKGNRPSWLRAANHAHAIPLYEYFVSKLHEVSGITIQTGVFGADMKVSFTNDGPVTICMDSKNRE